MRASSTPSHDVIVSKTTARPRLFVIERILDRREYASGCVELLIKWKGYGKTHNTWEPHNLIQDDCPALVASFEARMRNSIQSPVTLGKRTSMDSSLHAEQVGSADALIASNLLCVGSVTACAYST
jgi:hypothetical protein